MPCYARTLAAGAALLLEIATLHPLIDGSKRLAVVMLAAFLAKSRLPGPEPGSFYEAALRVASGEWSSDDVLRRLLRVYEANSKGRGE